jgi:hypothetical protein
LIVDESMPLQMDGDGIIRGLGVGPVGLRMIFDAELERTHDNP